MIDPKSVSIIIPHLGADEQQKYALKECLTSLRETVPNIKKIIALNGYSGTMKLDEDSELKENEEFIKLSEQGQNKAVNAAVATTNTSWIFVTNDDMNYAPGWWEKLTRNLGSENAAREPIRCISPRLIEPRTGAPSFEVFFAGGAGGDFDKQKWLEFARNYRTYMGTRYGFNLPFLIQKEVFDLVGGYDIQYDPWGASSDTDLQCKVELAGVKTYQDPKTIVYHFSQTSGTFLPENHGYWAKNYAYFQEKWGFERPGDPDVWFSKDLIKYDQLKYQPWWKDFYKKKTPESKTELS